jgi:hypothetical protein
VTPNDRPPGPDRTLRRAARPRRAADRLLFYFGPYVRKVSIVLALVGLLVAFYAEAFSDVRAGRAGRRKPPMVEQRVVYITMVACGLPGLAWGLVRTARGRQTTLWE